MINSMKMNVRLAGLILFLLCSCSGSHYEKSFTIDNESWDADNILQFKVAINDLTSRHNVLIHIRNTTDYPYSNIFMFIHVLYPDNSEKIDTVEGYITDSKGMWLGSGSGRYKSNDFVYKRNILFPMKGTYIFTVEQAMREESLDGISTVGMEVVTIKPQ
jgi:gliding motility-associated lipoprotein GldH